MKHEILFRAKRKDHGEWIESFTLFKPDQHLYMFKTAWGEITYDLHYNITAITRRKEPFFVEVIPETVGQYTGLTDKNGVKIFERDIVKKTEGIPSVKKVEFHENEAAFIATWKIHRHELYDLLRAYTMPGRNDVEFFEVIGNIYDNPELLKGELK